MNIIEKILNRLLKKKVIVNCDRDPYLHRWYLLRTKRMAIFIHKFVRSDEDRALHDHPWNFLVIPIWRGYVEHSDRVVICDCEQGATYCEMCEGDGAYREPVRRRVLPFIGTRYRDATYRHRVELLRADEFRCGNPGCSVCKSKELPSWSVFVRFTERRQWGFWPKEGWIAFNKWWQEKCE